MESLLNKYNTSIHSRMRSGHNKENQAPAGGNLRFKNHSNGPIGIPFKAKNSNSLHFHNHGMNSLRNHHAYDKLNLNKSVNNTNGLNLHINGLNSNYLRKTNTSYSSDDGMNSLTSSANSLFMMNNKNNANQLSNSNSSQHKLNDLYKSHLSGSTSSLLSYSSSNENSIKDDRCLSQSSKQNMMQEQRFPFDLSRYKTELCRAYEEQKNCVYGDRCMFAHGYWELKRPINRHPKYKTQKCVAFEEQGLCMFGTRCSFLHEKIGSAEDIIDAILRLNKQTFQMPENPNKKSNLDLSRLDTIDEQELLAKSLDGMEERAQFLSSLNCENLFDGWTTSKPAFNFHPRSSNSAYENIIRLDCLNEFAEKDKLLPDITSLLVDDHANSNSLFFNDGLNGSDRLPIFEKISANTTPLEMSTNESQSAIYQISQNLMDALNSSNNSSKSSESTNSFDSTTSSSMSLCSSNSDTKSIDFEIEKFF